MGFFCKKQTGRAKLSGQLQTEYDLLYHMSAKKFKSVRQNVTLCNGMPGRISTFFEKMCHFVTSSCVRKETVIQYIVSEGAFAFV